MVVQRILQVALWIKHEVDIVGGRVRAIPDKAERMLAVGRTTHIGAQEWRGRALFLGVPRGAMAREIRLVNFLLAARSADTHRNEASRLNLVFRLAAIKK